MRGSLLGAMMLTGITVAWPAAAQAPAVTLVAVQSPQDRRNFEAGILDSTGGPVFQSIQRLFPAEYNRLIDKIFKAAAPHLGDNAALLRAGQVAMADFFKRKMPDAVNAPLPALAAINQSQLDLVKALRKDHATACAQYLDAGFDGTTTLPLPLQQKAMGVSILMLEAAKAGSERPRDRSRGSLDEEAAVAWVAKMAEVEPSPIIQKMLDDDAAQAAATPDQNCQMGIAIYAAIAELPREQAAKMTAYLLKSGMEP
ncbi:MAG: hypothetical protein H0W74_03425 [Sphingosinicella sp.]|nr:hypothetical protein [Sphingosinicella sp.]